MFNARKLLLLAFVAAAAITIAAPTSFGQSNPENHETLEFVNEPLGTHCGALSKPTAHTVSGGCLIHATSNGSVELRKHVFGIESHITNCSAEFQGRVNEDAEGFMINQVLSGINCQRQPCKEAGEAGPTPWPAHGDEAHDPGIDGETGVSAVSGHTEIMTTVFCAEPVGGGADESCELVLPVNQIPSTHTAEYGAAAPTELTPHGVSGYRCEMVGHWTTETGGAGEVNVAVPHIADEDQAESP
jgi:hypothetical protein